MQNQFAGSNQISNLKTTLGSRIKDLGNNTKLLDPRNTAIDKTNYTSTDKISKTDAIADQLVEKFNSPSHRPFFLKVAWRLSENKIDRLIGLSCGGHKCDRAYFITCAKNEIGGY